MVSPADVTAFFRRHPLLRDALLWAIPALLVGLALRLVLLSYSPYAYWGADSRSFFGFTNGVLNEFYFSINEKRRYLYPLFVFPLTFLPGGTLRALAWVQAGMGVLTILPFAYFIRRVFVGWKWLIVPLTVLFAGIPIFLWNEHELIAEAVFFNGIVWALAGWAAWVSQRDPDRARRLWWAFFVPFAIIVLTKPSLKFYWPGLAIALVAVLAWRTLRWKEWVALGALFLAGLTVGDDDQAVWLLYNTAFPLTRLDTPLHAEYKAEIADWVRKKRAAIDDYSNQDYEVQYFLRGSDKSDTRPLWRKLMKHETERERVYKDLALEGIRSRPDLFGYIALQRLLRSANLSDFKSDRFKATYNADRFVDQIAHNRNPESMVRYAFGLSRHEPMPDAAQFYAWLAPHPDSAAAKWLVGFVDAYERAGDLMVRPQGDSTPIWQCRPTPLAWWLLLGIALSLIPPYLRTLGVWNVMTLGYLCAVYLVGIQQTRYIGSAWPVFLLTLGVGIDWPLRWLASRRKVPVAA
jgi:hypothetical protein